MRYRKRDCPAEDFQMAPMIDMVFLLLVFFMCVSTLARANHSLKVGLPESRESRVAKNTAGRFTVSVLRGGRLFLGSRQVTEARLGTALKTEAVRHPGIKVVLRVGKTVPFSRVKPVLGLCGDAGISRIIYATYQKE